MKTRPFSKAAKASLSEHSKLALDYLTSKSTLLSVAASHDEVQSDDVKRAFQGLLTSGFASQRWRQVLGGIGTIVLGAAGQAFYAEYYASSPKREVFLTSALAGFLALVLWLISIFKK